MQLPDEPRWVEADGSPVLVADLHTSRNRLDHWLPRLESLDDVRVPETFLVDLVDGDSVSPAVGGDAVDADAVVAEMAARDWDRAFVRSTCKHAELKPREGSMVYRRDPAVVSRTVDSLLAQHEQMGMPTGGRLAFREWLDLDYGTCDVPAHNRHEIGFFVGDGDVRYHFPSADELVASNLECDALYSYVRELLEGGIEAPVEQAAAVATEFDEYAWHVDFDLTSRGDWYCVDLGIDGVYYNERRGEWIDVAQHAPESEHSPSERLPAEFDPFGGSIDP